MIRWLRGKGATSDEPEVHPVSAFWAWWADGGEQRLTAALAAAEVDRMAGEISRLVAAIHPDLDWELGRGRSAQHLLCVSAAGIAELRPLAERWVRAAPLPSAVWEFHPARQADPDVLDQTLEIAGSRVPLADLRVALHVDEDRVDVAVWHPAMTGMPEGARTQLAFLTLDWALGEDDVTRWVGEVASPAHEPAGAVPVDVLRTTVADLASRTREDTWAVLEGRAADGSRAMVTVRRPLRWIDRPLLDLHSEITVPVVGPRPDGLPGSDGLARLRDLEDELVAALAGRAELLAHESREGRRIFHLYSDGEDQNATDLIARWAGERGLPVEQRPDPAWRDLRAFS